MNVSRILALGGSFVRVLRVGEALGGGGGVGEARFVVFYKGLRLWEARFVVFYDGPRVLGGLRF